MHQTNGEELLEMYLNAFTMSFDPHTDYMSPRTQKNFEIAMSLELEGIGASLMSEDGYTVVKKIIPGGAAAKDGRIKINDKIIGVGQGDEGEIVDVVDMKLSDVVEMIRGKPGTVVRLEVIARQRRAKEIYKITREKIALTDSEAQGKVFEAGKKPDGSPYRIGVIDLPSFYRDTEAERRGDPDFKSATRDVRAILDDFRQKGVDAVDSRSARQRRRCAERGHQPHRACSSTRAGGSGEGPDGPRPPALRLRLEASPGRVRWSC